MPKPIVILVHGMGEHKTGELEKQFITAMNAAMKKYKGFKTKKIEKLVDIKEINYDGFFDEMRQKMKDDSKPIVDRLNSISAINGLNWGPELVLKLTSVESGFGNDEFLYTHILDVVFYATLLGAKVRVDVGREISNIIANHSNRDIHIVAHSLGTAVVHDTLALLYHEEIKFGDGVPDLDVVTHKLSSVWMIANVSALVNSITRLTDPYNSTVKPTANGCTNFMVNVRHKLDPFTWLARFDPSNDESWIPKVFFENAYRSIETKAIRKLNTHDFSEYIENPLVSVPLLRRLVDLDPKISEVDTVTGDFLKDDIVGAFAALKEALEDIDITDSVTLKAFAEAGGKFRAVFKNFQEQFDAI